VSSTPQARPTLAAARATCNASTAAARGSCQGLRPLPCRCCVRCTTLLLLLLLTGAANKRVRRELPGTRPDRDALLPALSAGTLRTARALLLTRDAGPLLVARVMLASGISPGFSVLQGSCGSVARVQGTQDSSSITRQLDEGAMPWFAEGANKATTHVLV
jgi:hypothetical protein